MKGQLMKLLTVLVLIVAIAASLLAAFLFAAQSADDIQIPAGYRKWFHVNTMIVDKASPLFDVLGGMHNIHVNSAGEAALKKGGPYPDKTIFLSDVHDFTVSDGTYVEGPRKLLASWSRTRSMHRRAAGAGRPGPEEMRKSRW
jgi:cytochrome P460